MYKKFDEANEEVFLKNKQKRKNKNNSNKKRKKSNVTSILIKILCVIIAIIVLLGVAFAGVWIYGLLRKPPSNDNKLSSSDQTHFTNEQGVTVETDDLVYTYLATGTDKSGGLTDVIMVAKYDIDKKSVSILQIPRDTYVFVSGTLYYDDEGNLTKDNFIKENSSGIKINAAYSHGRNLSEKYLNKLLKQANGKTDEQIKALCESKDFAFLGLDYKKVVDYTKQTNSSEKNAIFKSLKRDFGINYLSTLIHYNFGIPIDYHAQVNLSGFRGVVNAIDGVDLYVPQDMYYNDPTQDLYINLKKGQQHLDGEKAEDFVRFRSGYARADLARLDAQKIFMTAFLKKLFSPSTIPKIDNVITEISKNLYTNLPLGDMIYFGQRALEIDLSNNITMTTLPGTDANIDGLSYYTVNKKAVVELVNKDFNKYTEALSADSFLMVEAKSSPVTVVSTTISDIENNAPDLGFLPEGTDHGLDDVSDDTTVEDNIDEENQENQETSDSENNSEQHSDNENNEDNETETENVVTEDDISDNQNQTDDNSEETNTGDDETTDISNANQNDEQITQSVPIDDNQNDVSDTHKENDSENSRDANQALLESMLQNRDN